MLQNNEVMRAPISVNSANRLLVLSLERSNGFIHNAESICRAGGAAGDYHGQMNAADFQKMGSQKINSQSSPSVSSCP